MTFTVKAIAGVAAGAALVLGPMRLLSSGPQAHIAPSPAITTAPTAVPDSAVVDRSEGAAVAPERANLVSYAIAVNELHGLPPRAAAGTVLDLWVAWEPPVTKEPKIHRLVSNVILEEIAPPLLPDGPHAALLLVKPNQLSDLLYGDRYGSLSVAIPQS